MTILICVCDFWNKCSYLLIEDKNNLRKLPRKPWSSTRPAHAADSKSMEQQQVCNSSGPNRSIRRLRLMVDGIEAFYLLREIEMLNEFRLRLLENPALRQMQLLWLQLEPPEKEIIDYRWNRMLQYTLWEKIEVDHMMSWLSTLGGGYSALGEQFSRCAETAGKISLKQLAIGMRLGDPFLQARCKLYYSISLIQTGRLRSAKHIVREQYQFARRHKESDGRLVKMCQGIWMRVQYEYGLRQMLKEQQKRTCKSLNTIDRYLELINKNV